MKPLIFPNDAVEFTTLGHGPLTCISCEVEEERNGIYELTAVIPSDSPRFEMLEEGSIIVATHSNKGDRQPFQIYSVKKTIDGLAEVKAEHISYRLNKIVTMPFEATGIQAALNGLKTNATEDCPFTFWTDKESNVKYKLKVPKTIKSSLAGSDGSIVDTFSSGDYEFDVFDVKFWGDRGEDNGITVRYGKNLTELKKETDISDIYTAIVPYWTGQDDDGNEQTVMLSSTPANNVVRSAYVDAFPTLRTVAVDFTDKFEEQPTEEQLRTAAEHYLSENVRRQLFTSITASFVELSQTDQYKDVYKMEKVNLCDTVTVIHPQLGISDKLRVTRVVYDVLADRNKEITLGDLKKTLANVIGGRGSATKGAAGANGKSAYQIAVDNGYTGTEQEWLASLGGGLQYSSKTYYTNNTMDGGIAVSKYGNVFEFASLNMNLTIDSNTVSFYGTHDGAYTKNAAVGGSGFYTRANGAFGKVLITLYKDNTWIAVFRHIAGETSNNRMSTEFSFAFIFED